MSERPDKHAAALRARRMLLTAQKELLSVAASHLADAEALLRELRLDQYANQLAPILEAIDDEFYRDLE